MQYNYRYTPLWYDGFIQVRYYNFQRKEKCVGIAYRDKLCDAKTAEIYEIQNIIDNAAIDGIDFEKAIVELSWNDLTEAIMAINNNTPYSSTPEK